MVQTLTQSDRLSNEIRVRTKSFMVSDESDPWKHNYYFAYRITITNEGRIPARLVSRHWIITDALGQVEEVKGRGVVGEQPHLSPGQSFEYTSACPLTTRYGTMHGTYHMVRDDGTTFDAQIGPFTLLHSAVLN